MEGLQRCLSGSKYLCSCRGSEFSSQHPHGSPKPSVTPVPGDPMPYSGLRELLLLEHVHVNLHRLSHIPNSKQRDEKQPLNSVPGRSAGIPGRGSERIQIQTERSHGFKRLVNRNPKVDVILVIKGLSYTCVRVSILNMWPEDVCTYVFSMCLQILEA